MDKYQELKEHYNDIERHYIVKEFTDKDKNQVITSLRQQANKHMLIIIECAILMFPVLLCLSHAYYQGTFSSPGIIAFLICEHPLMLPASLLIFGLTLYAIDTVFQPEKTFIHYMQETAKELGATFATTSDNKYLLFDVEPVDIDNNLLSWCMRVLSTIEKIYPEAADTTHRLMKDIRSDDKSVSSGAVIYTEILNDQLVHGNESFLEEHENFFYNYRFFNDNECDSEKCLN